MRADKVRAVERSVEFGGQVSGPNLRNRAAGQFAQERFARHRNEDGEAERGLKLRQAAQDGERDFGPGAHEEAHAGIKDESLACDASMRKHVYSGVEEV